MDKQYELVRKRTSNNYTYNMGSHVLQFGSLSIDEEPAADYLGELNTGEQLVTPCCSCVKGLRFQACVDVSWHAEPLM